MTTFATSSPPPKFQFAGLAYNPTFWITTDTTTALTQATANQLYLKKTVPDSSSVLESFNGGLKASSFDFTTGSNPANLFASQTAAVNFLTNATTLTIGAAATFTKPITLPTPAQTGITQLGFISTPAITTSLSSLTTAGTDYNVGYFSLPIGVWIVETSMLITTLNATQVVFSINTNATSTEDANRRVSTSTNATSGAYVRLTTTLSATAATQYYFVAKSALAATAVSGLTCVITRIG